ncbi:MAG: alpha/beta fold hydrolase [Myxococcales bacterium]|nr:alpha/beta fold hydrolase [Myxococcales bacterium]
MAATVFGATEHGMHRFVEGFAEMSATMASILAHRFARVAGVELHWAELGAGRPILLLHGLCDSHRTWLPVAPALARSRRVLMLDLAGHGQSSRPDASYTLDWHASVVGAWLEALNLEEVDLVGHSFGAASPSGCSSPIASASAGSGSSPLEDSVARWASRSGGPRYRSSSSASASRSWHSARSGRSTQRAGRSRTKRSRCLCGSTRSPAPRGPSPGASAT